MLNKKKLVAKEILLPKKGMKCTKCNQKMQIKRDEMPEGIVFEYYKCKKIPAH